MLPVSPMPAQLQSLLGSTEPGKGMEQSRYLPQRWPAWVANRLSVSDAELTRLMRKDERFRETCMDYAECVAVVQNASHNTVVDLRRVQEYRSLAREIADELGKAMRQLV